MAYLYIINNHKKIYSILISILPYHKYIKNYKEINKIKSLRSKRIKLFQTKSQPSYLNNQRKVVDFDTQIRGVLDLVESPDKLHEVGHVDSFVFLSVHEIDEVRQQFNRRQFKYRLVR